VTYSRTSSPGLTPPRRDSPCASGSRTSGCRRASQAPRRREDIAARSLHRPAVPNLHPRLRRPLPRPCRAAAARTSRSRSALRPSGGSGQASRSVCDRRHHLSRPGLLPRPPRRHRTEDAHERARPDPQGAGRCGQAREGQAQCRRHGRRPPAPNGGATDGGHRTSCAPSSPTSAATGCTPPGCSS
jgi:hypothetical protein